MGQDYILDGLILRNCSSLSAILLNLDKQHTKDRLLPSFCFTAQSLSEVAKPFLISTDVDFRGMHSIFQIDGSVQIARGYTRNNVFE